MNFYSEGSEMLHTTIPSIILLLRQAGCVRTNRHLFRQPDPQKMRELYILCLEGGLASPKRAQITGCAALRRIFSSNKSAPANRKKGFYTSRLQKNKNIRWIFV
jgi:hypothetical protein